MLYSMTLAFNFKVKTFYCYALLIKSVQATDVPGRFASTRTALTVALFLFLSLLTPKAESRVEAVEAQRNIKWMQRNLKHKTLKYVQRQRVGNI